MDGYATHLQLLVRACMVTSGPVLELGMGDYSTPVLLELCRSRYLLCFENDPDWFKNRSPFFVRDNCHAKLVAPDWSDFKLEPVQFSVGFVDAHPPHIRPSLIAQIVPQCDVIVAHDSESLAFDWSPFKYTVRGRPWPNLPETIAATNIPGLL